MYLHIHNRNQFRSQRPRSFWSEGGDRDLSPNLWPGTTPEVRDSRNSRHSAMPRVKCDKSDWFWCQSIVFSKPFKIRMSLGLARGPDFQRMTKGTLGTRLDRNIHSTFSAHHLYASLGPSFRFIISERNLHISLPFSAKQQREMTKFCVFWRTLVSTANILDFLMELIAGITYLVIAGFWTDLRSERV